MKTKLITLMLAVLAAVSLLSLTACGNGNAISDTASDVSSFEGTLSSAELELNSESLGIYVQDTDNDGIPDKVVDKDGNDLSHLYTLKEDGIYESETLVLSIGNIQAYIAGEENTEPTVEPIAEEPQAGESDTNNTNTGGQTNQNSNTSYTPPNNGNTNTSGNSGTTQTPSVPQRPANPTIPTTPQPETPSVQHNTPAPQPQIHAPIYKQQWVVDQAAWSEEVPVYTMVPVMICNDCGAYLHTGAINPYEHISNHTLNGGKGSWTDTYETQQTGTKTIYHEEVGHWENVLVCNGCTGLHTNS